MLLRRASAGWVLSLGAVILSINLSGSAKAQGRFPPEDRILSEVAQSASQIRSVLDQIDLTKLPLEYREGKILEERRELSIRWLRRLAEKMATFKTTGLLSDHLEALLALRELEANVDNLIGGLASPVTYSQTEAVKTSLDWARKLLDARKELNQASLKLQSAVLDAVVRADAFLARCGGTPQ